MFGRYDCVIWKVWLWRDRIVNFTFLQKILLHEKYLSQGILIFNKIILQSLKDVSFVLYSWSSTSINTKIKKNVNFRMLQGILIGSSSVEKILFM